jgi:hypothetical protein
MSALLGAAEHHVAAAPGAGDLVVTPAEGAAQPPRYQSPRPGRRRGASSPCRRTPYRATACDYDPSPWLISMLDGVLGSDRHGHEAGTSKVLDHKDRLWQTCHARWWSSTSAGFPTSTSHDGPRRALVRWITTLAKAAPGIRATAWTPAK